MLERHLSAFELINSEFFLIFLNFLQFSSSHKCLSPYRVIVLSFFQVLLLYEEGDWNNINKRCNDIE